MAKRATSATEATVCFWEEKVQQVLKPKLNSNQLKQFKQQISKIVDEGIRNFGFCRLDWTHESTGAINCVLYEMGVNQTPKHPVLTESTLNLVRIEGVQKPVWQQ
ncbi:hypothetical protein [Shimazuella alba]|uniref:Uncharacterized protein n=1 Tax=Shimazuella alba TaxID=2690964 RepID=A0A6I4VMW8_9BACL|nr:hypothetical protein [Shimazuella alba]MXQ52817.1 hypothetical protein [Shimazuella alba]